MNLPAADAAALTPTAGVAPESQRLPTKRDAVLELCRRRDAGEALPAAAEPIDLSGERFVEMDLSGLDLTRVDLSDAILLTCNLSESRLVGANLTGAVLHDSALANVELLGADISRADFSNANLDRAGLGQVTGHEALFFGAQCGAATFSGADLTEADFRAAKLKGSRMLGTVLTGSVFASADLSEVDFTGAHVGRASFRDADLKGSQLRNISEYHEADWIRADIQNVDFTGAWLVRRHILDENYIQEFRTQSPIHEHLYKLWWVTSDCGRSLSRWSLWTVLVAMIYAGLYTTVDIDWGDYETPISPLYYSVVTFTTLGYGDVLPGSTAAQLLAMSEVILGYFSLGGMMSILSDKMARRAG